MRTLFIIALVALPGLSAAQTYTPYQTVDPYIGGQPQQPPQYRPPPPPPRPFAAPGYATPYNPDEQPRPYGAPGYATPYNPADR